MHILGHTGAGGGSCLADSKAYYAMLSLSSLPGCHSISQPTFIAGAPQS